MWYFILGLLPTQITNAQEKLDDLAATLTDFMTTTCQCAISLNNSRFQCFEDQDAVIFRAQVWPTDAAGAELVQEFINDRSSLTVDGDQLDVDPSCAANVSSFAAPGCSSTSSSDSGTNLVWMIITGTLSGVLIVVIATATVFILALLLRLSRQKKLPGAEARQAYIAWGLHGYLKRVYPYMPMQFTCIYIS